MKKWFLALFCIDLILTTWIIEHKEKTCFGCVLNPGPLTCEASALPLHHLSYTTTVSCCRIKYWFTVICENSSYEQTHAHTYTHNHSHTHTYVLFHMFLVDLNYTLVKCWYEISVFLKYENFNILITTSIQIQHFPIPKTTASEYHNIG